MDLAFCLAFRSLIEKTRAGWPSSQNCLCFYEHVDNLFIFCSILLPAFFCLSLGVTCTPQTRATSRSPHFVRGQHPRNPNPEPAAIFAEPQPLAPSLLPRSLSLQVRDDDGDSAVHEVDDAVLLPENVLEERENQSELGALAWGAGRLRDTIDMCGGSGSKITSQLMYKNAMVRIHAAAECMALHQEQSLGRLCQSQPILCRQVRFRVTAALIVVGPQSFCTHDG